MKQNLTQENRKSPLKANNLRGWGHMGTKEEMGIPYHKQTGKVSLLLAHFLTDGAEGEELLRCLPSGHASVFASTSLHSPNRLDRLDI